LNDQATRREAGFLKIKRASDINLDKNIRQLVPAKTLLLLDRGYDNFSWWRQLIEQEIHFITGLKKEHQLNASKYLPIVTSFEIV